MSEHEMQRAGFDGEGRTSDLSQRGSDQGRRIDKAGLHLEITRHIFINSPTMLALCLTSIGLIKIYTTLQRVTTLADNALVISVIAFMVATMTSYLALRSVRFNVIHVLARTSDIFFLLGLVVLSCVAVFVVVTLAG